MSVPPPRRCTASSTILWCRSRPLRLPAGRVDLKRVRQHAIIMVFANRPLYAPMYRILRLWYEINGFRRESCSRTCVFVWFFLEILVIFKVRCFLVFCTDNKHVRIVKNNEKDLFVLLKYVLWSEKNLFPQFIWVSEQDKAYLFFLKILFFSC